MEHTSEMRRAPEAGRVLSGPLCSTAGGDHRPGIARQQGVAGRVEACDPVAWGVKSLCVLFAAAVPFLPAPALAQDVQPGSDGSVLPSFVDVTAASGVRFHHSFGDEDMSNIIESSGSGCATFDYDNDGWMDLYLVNCGYHPPLNEGPEGDRDVGASNRLYRNTGDGRFVDVTKEAGCGDTGYGMGCAIGDIDNDGHSDIYVTNYGRNSLYRNNGDGTFSDITAAAGVGDSLCGIGCTFLDYDNDGFLDLYVGNYLEYDPEYRLFFVADRFPGPMAYSGQPDVLYRNNGDGTFSDVTGAAGVAGDGRAMGVVSGDYDGDGRIDIFVANDAMTNYLYRNNGDGTFTDVALEAGVGFSASGDASSSMGGDLGDFDNDGDLDLLVPDMSFNNLYLNGGEGLFQDVTATIGLAEASGQYVSWGGDFGDYDNDGYLDILISNGDAHRLDSMEPLLLLNVPDDHGTRRFKDVSTRCGPWFRHKSVARGMTVGDFDNDGDLDVLTLNLDQPSQLARNDCDNGNHWLVLDLVGTLSNRDGVGARVVIRVGGMMRIGERRSASGYLSQNDPRLHFGLGSHAQVDEIEVRWPSGVVQRMENVAVDQVLTVQEAAE